MDERLIEDINHSYRLNIDTDSIIQISGGWLNLKYRCESDGCAYLVKVFSHERYNSRQLEHIGRALEFQEMLNLRGIPCPEIFADNNGSVMHRTEHGEVYSVMSFCEGRAVGYGDITTEQLESLGKSVRMLKREFERLTENTADLNTVRGYPLDCRGIVSALKSGQAELSMAANETVDNRLREITDAYKRGIESLDICSVNGIGRGLAHEDMSHDNMLFFDDRLSVFLDFDRTQYSFVPHDIGRVLMSYTFDEEKMMLIPERIRAFKAGFGDFDIAEALMCVWLIEAPWWLNVRSLSEVNPKIARFCRELIWLTDNISNIDDIICDL